MSDTVFITTSGAARILRVADGTVRQMARRGQLPAIRTESGIALFDRTAIERIARDRVARRPVKTPTEAA